MGVLLEAHNIAQVSINLVNFTVTPPHVAFEEVKRQAATLGVEVTGSEIVGLTPLEALRMAGAFYAPGVTDDETACGIGRRKARPEPAGAIRSDEEDHRVSTLLREGRSMATRKTMHAFLDEVASSSPAPGGGSVAALAGALGAALTSMVCNLTVGKKKYADVEDEMKKVLEQSEHLRVQFTELIERDTTAFNKVMEAITLPKDTDPQKALRSAAIREATKEATLVPLEVMKHCIDALALAQAVASKGNANSVSDAGVSRVHAACGPGKRGTECADQSERAERSRVRRMEAG